VALAFVRVWVYMDGGVPLRRCGVWVHEAGRPSDCALYMAGYTNWQLPTLIQIISADAEMDPVTWLGFVIIRLVADLDRLTWIQLG